MLINKYLKWGLIILVVILIIGAILGDQTDEETEITETDVNIDHKIISQRDMSFENDNNDNIVSSDFNIVVNEQVSTEELKTIFKEIVAQEKNYNDINAISINFYDYEEFTTDI